MIANNPYNRSILRNYLDNTSEDNFIDEVIIPLFSLNGYLLYRRNTHGPGEHGKDLIFYRHVRLFNDNEYVVVQAKAERVTTGNVSKLADQLVRAFKVPFPGGKGKTGLLPHYVYFVNAKTHTNDAYFEFPYLADLHDNIKIISGDMVAELMISFNLIPESLAATIETYDLQVSELFQDSIRKVIMSGDNVAINKLLDYDLKIETRQLSPTLKELIINYIFDKWEGDRSWAGTVRPMKWLRQYFSFIQPSQYQKLLLVIREHISSTPSFEAEADTAAVVKNILPVQIKSFEKEFYLLLIQEFRSAGITKHPLLLEKAIDYQKANTMSKEFPEILNKVVEYSEIRQKIISSSDENEKTQLRTRLKLLDTELYRFAYPDEYYN